MTTFTVCMGSNFEKQIMYSWIYILARQSLARESSGVLLDIKLPWHTAPLVTGTTPPGAT